MLRELDAAVRKLLSIEAHLEGADVLPPVDRQGGATQSIRWCMMSRLRGPSDCDGQIGSNVRCLAEGMTEDRDHRAAVERARDGEEVGDVWRVAQPPWKVADRLVRLPHAVEAEEEGHLHDPIVEASAAAPCCAAYPLRMRSRS